MTVAILDSRIEYTGNGVTVAFTFPFRVIQPSEVGFLGLVVFVAGVQRFDYTVTGGTTDAGGTVTLSAAPANGASVWLIRTTAQTQPVDLHEYDSNSAETQELEYDRITLMVQDLQAQVDRCLQFSETAHLTGISPIFPLPGAGQNIAWNAGGTALTTTTSGGGGGGGVAGVTSLSGLTGVITLLGDANISITPLGVGITVGLKGIVPTTKGGTGVGTFTANGALYGAGTGNILATSAPAPNTVLSSNGGAPFFSPSPTLSALVTVGTGIQLIPYAVGAGQTGEVRWTELAANGINYVGFKAPDSIAVDRIWVLPNVDGTAGQMLTTNGALALSWTTPGGGGGAVTGAAATSQATFWTSATAVGGSVQFTWDDTNKVLTSGPAAAQIDALTWAAAALRVGRTISGVSNFFGQSIQVFSAVSGSTTDYEKAGLIIQAQTNDPSSSHNLDMVGVDSRAIASATNPLGRVWGMVGTGVITAGGDGLALGGAFSVENGGTSQAAVDTSTSKYVLQLAASGNPISAAIILEGAATFHKALYANPTVFASSTASTFLELLGLFTVLADGTTKIGGGSTGVYGSGTMLTVASPASSFNTAATARIENRGTGTNQGRTALALVHTTSAAQMIDGFSVYQDFVLRDVDAVENIVGRFLITRSGGDAAAAFGLQTATLADGLQTRLLIDGSGNPSLLGRTTLQSATWGTPLNLGVGPAIADGAIYDNVLLNSRHCGRFVNFSGASQTADGDTVLAMNVYKGGGAGTSDKNGIAVSHLGVGTGDNFYAQAAPGATEFRDALYRGDLASSAPTSGGIGPPIVFSAFLVAGCEPTANGVRVRDLRTITATAHQIEVLCAEGANAGIELANTFGAGRRYGIVSDVNGDLIIQESTGGVVEYRQTSANTHRFHGGGIVIDTTATGGDKGAGTINVSTNVFKNGTAYTNPHYVFEHFFTGQIVRFADREGAATYPGLRSLDAVEAFVREHSEFPLLAAIPGRGLFDGGDALLATLEESYLHLFDHERRIRALEARLAAA